MIHIPYEYVPEFHRLLELPVTKTLRRETGLESLVTYHHQMTDNYVIALLDRRTNALMDLMLMGSGKGEAPDMTREAKEQFVKRMKTLVPKAEAVAARKAYARRQAGDATERSARLNEAHHVIAADIKTRRGSMKSEQYLHDVGHPLKPEEII